MCFLGRNFAKFQLEKYDFGPYKYGQIWLTHLMDDHHFSYVTKLKEKKPCLYHYSIQFSWKFYIIKVIRRVV